MKELQFRQFVNGYFHYWGFLEDNVFVGPINPQAPSQQFTGRLDKNKKKIFAGDILKCVAGKCPYCGTPDSEPIGHKPYPVFWDTNEARFKAENADNYLLPDCWGDSTEIIGNVVEHPELLTP
jgi:hypothetical protein